MNNQEIDYLLRVMLKEIYLERTTVVHRVSKEQLEYIVNVEEYAHGNLYGHMVDNIIENKLLDIQYRDLPTGEREYSTEYILITPEKLRELLTSILIRVGYNG